MRDTSCGAPEGGGGGAREGEAGAGLKGSKKFKLIGMGAAPKEKNNSIFFIFIHENNKDICMKHPQATDMIYLLLL